MYRPGGFPERNPKEQKIFDRILSIVEQTFRQYNYHHIWTPAVEPVHILKKGGDIGDKQVFGLFGLAQGVEDVKDYALHFDLTVPLARYILDHKNDITFPFSRYQMQPVWRGERTKRGRYKEFWQMDVDTIWPSQQDVGIWYDVQSIFVMDTVMSTLAAHFGIHIEKIAKVSHVGVTKAYLIGQGCTDETIRTVYRILDGYYKKTPEQNEQLLHDCLPSSVVEKLLAIIRTHDRTLLSQVPGYDALDAICQHLDMLGISYEYDICIVRGHDYYSGMVVERFDIHDPDLGSLAAGGRYDNLTQFIDPKQLFSGVGTSLGRFMYLLMEKVQTGEEQPSYLFLHFPDTYADIIDLYKKFLAAGYICELYPTAQKLGKQFEYADRVGISSCVLYGPGEKEKDQFALKDMKTGETTIGICDYSYGVAPVYYDAQRGWMTLLVQHTHGGHRSFSKGHREPGESDIQTAKRELFEETGISIDALDENTALYEHYLYPITQAHIDTPDALSADVVLKKVTYFLGHVSEESYRQSLQYSHVNEKEIVQTARLPLGEAEHKATHPQHKTCIHTLRTLLAAKQPPLLS